MKTFSQFFPQKITTSFFPRKLEAKSEIMKRVDFDRGKKTIFFVSDL